MKVKGDLSQMLFQNSIKRVLKALVIAFVMLVSPAFATTYNITYELDGGTLASGVSNPATYDDDTLKVLDLPIKSGYVFKGWYENSNFTGDPVKWISANSTSGDKTYYAKWGTFESKFQITTTDDIVSDGTGSNDYFAFKMSAEGVFYVDWGDNSGIEVIDRRGNTAYQYYTHTYTNTTARSYDIKFDGQATGYEDFLFSQAILFGYAGDDTVSVNENRTVSGTTYEKVAGISGSLGALFPTIGGADATIGLVADSSALKAIQPRFVGVFEQCTFLAGTIPDELFNGVGGQAAPQMFDLIFKRCYSLTGTIPVTLFAGIISTTIIDPFEDTSLLTSCPDGTHQATTGFESYFDGYVACVAADKVYCKKGERFDTNTNACVTCQSGYTCPELGAIYTCPNGMGGNSTSTACIAPNSITYNLNGGTNNPDNSSTYLTSTTLKDPSKANYKFMGWYKNADFTGVEVKTLVHETDGDVTLYAKWGTFENKFQITTTDNIVSDGTGTGDYFVFGMSAAGVFWVDWGDGTIERIDRTNNTTEQYYSHTYTNTIARSYDIKFDGRATGYNDCALPAVSFQYLYGASATSSVNENRTVVGPTGTLVAGISGSLGALFPTIGATDQYDPTAGLNPYSDFCGLPIYSIQPSFSGTFLGSSLTGSIPAGLFSGVRGQPIRGMFSATFVYTYVTSIPAGLFSGISGVLVRDLFNSTFRGCRRLTGTIPVTLFAGIDVNTDLVNPMSGVFYESGLSTSCPDGTRQATTGFESYFDGRVACVADDEIYCARGSKYNSATRSCDWCSSNDTCNTGFVQQCPTGYISNAKAAYGYDSDSTATQCLQGYTITYNNMAGATNSSDNPLTYTVEDLPITLHNPTKRFYTFSGWYDDDRFIDTVTQITTTGGQTLYAKWTLSANSITYNLNGGSNDSDNPSLYDETVTLKDPSKANYKFMGWYKNADFTGAEVKTLVPEVDGSVTLYAKWGTFENKFQITTTNDIVSDGTGTNDYFQFQMSAAGVFWIDWGDGTIERIDRTNNTTKRYYFHTYTNTTARSYDIKFDGLATGYSTGSYIAAIVFGSDGYGLNTQLKVAGISGSLGALFPTIGATMQYDPTAGLAYDSDALSAIQPKFTGTFSGCTRLIGLIPGNLFSGIRGQIVQAMFYDMFYYCRNLGHDVYDFYGPDEYYIPATLFAGLDANTTITNQMSEVFSYTSLRTSCPDGTHKATTGFDNYFGNKVACVADDEIYCKQGLKYDSTTKACAVCGSGDTCDTGFVQQCPTGYISNAKAAYGYDSNSTATQCLQEYSITYNNMADATNDADNPSSYTIETTLPITLREPTKSGFVFLGWYDNNQFTGSAITEIATGSTGDITLYAKWAPIYSITYDSMNADAEASTNPIQYYVGGSTLYYKNNANDISWSSVDYIKSLYSPTRDNFGFVGWCVFDSASEAAAANYDCTYPTKYLTARSDYSAYDYNYGGYLNVSNKTNLYLYAKWAPIYSITYDYTGATSVPYNPGNYWYDGNYYHYTDANSYEVSNSAIQLASPSGNQEFRGWYVCTSYQGDVNTAANSNDCTWFSETWSGSGETSVYGMYGANLYAYASFGPQIVNCPAGQYAYYNGVSLGCQQCPQNFYCDGMNSMGGSDLTAEDNGAHACSSANPNKAYSDMGAESADDCYFRCPSYHGYSSDSTSPYYVPIKTEEPYNFFYSSNADPVWKDFNGDGIESNSECIKPAYSINLETLKCSTPAAELQKQFGDYYYALGLDQPCNPNNMEAGLMSCNYDVSTGNYTGCSSMVTVCDASDLQTMAGLFMGNSASADDFLDIELGRKGLTQSTVNWNTLFKQNNSYINDISTLSSSANITKSSVGCDTQTCVAGEYARIEYVNGVGTGSCEPCPAGSFCPDSKTYSFANGDFSVDPTNSNVYTAGKFACLAGSTSAAGASACTCVSGSAYNPAGNSIVNISVGNMSTTKTPEVVMLTTTKGKDDVEYQACMNVYVSAINSTAFNSWVSGGMSSNDLLTQAGARVVMCKYNPEDQKYNLCSPAFTACNGTIAQLMLAPTGTVVDNLAQMFGEGSSLPDDIFEEVSDTFGVDTIQTANACPDPNMPQAIGGSCATGYYWEHHYDDKKERDVYTGNNCCPNGYACCLAGTTYDLSGKSETCIECSGASCPTTYTERVVCPEGSYIDQSAIGTNNQCVTCPVGHYCPGVSVEWNEQSTLTDEQAGKYACADGSYADETGLAACKICSGGMSTGGATGSTSDSACSTTTCVDGSQYDPAGTTFVSGAGKQSALVTFYDMKKNETYQSCTKAYVSVLDNTVFANGIANATADELSKSGMRLIMCEYDGKTGKYTSCSNAIPACDTSYSYMMLNYTTEQIATAIATQYGAPALPNVIMGNADASGALGIDGVRNFYGDASDGIPTCAASCPVGYEWESYYDDKNAETVYTGNTCCPDGYACCLAGYEYDMEEGRCVDCSKNDTCTATYTKSFVCPAGEYINQIGQNEYQCVTCDAGSYCPGIIWDVTTTFDSGKYTCAQNTFSGSGATECSACPTGSTSSAGSTSLSACTCPSGSATNPAGNSIVNVSVGNMSTIKTPEVITLTDDNDNEYSACANVYVSAVNMTAFNNWYTGGMSSDDLLTQAGARVIICKYNATDSKYNECTPAFTACNGQIAQLMLAPTGTIISNLAQMFGGGSSLSDDSFEQVSNTLGIDTLQTANACPDTGMPQMIRGSCATGYYWENYYDDKKERDVYTGNNCCPDGYACCLAGTKYDATTNSCQPCSGSSCPTTYTESVKPITCPATNGYYTSPAPINTTGGPGVIELDMQNMNLGTESSYGSSQDECVAIRVYYENSTPFMSAGGMENMTASDYVNAGASVAFCKYNPNTGHYDGDCTPKYSLCSTDNVMSLFASGNSVGVMKAVLGITNDNTIGNYFTESVSDLSKDSALNRCSGIVCPDASDFSNMSLSGAGMMQMGDGMEGSYGSTPNDCVAMRVYYNDGSVLFDGQSPSMDINDWIDAGASVAFCKYNTGNVATDLCTPKYSLCDTDNMMTLMSAGNAVGIMQAMLDINGTSALGTYFTQSPSSLASATATSRCVAASTTCSAGQYADANLECQACPEGYYCTGLNSTGGSDLTVEDNGKYACPSGSTSNGSTSSCTCDVGYSWNTSTHLCEGNTVHINWGDGVNTTCTYGSSYTVPDAPKTIPQGYTFIGYRIVSSVLNNNDNSNSNEQDNGEEIGKGE